LCVLGKICEVTLVTGSFTPLASSSGSEIFFRAAAFKKTFYESGFKLTFPIEAVAELVKLVPRPILLSGDKLFIKRGEAIDLVPWAALLSDIGEALPEYLSSSLAF
jgi:hypothetical protein